VNAGVGEHVHLEYKQQTYGTNHADRREFLLDICQFANTQGRILLIGVAEGAAGVPDPNANLGVQVANPEQLLLDYDARVATSIQDRLPLESAVIPIAGGTHVLAVRIPDSVNKPHCVNLEGHIYFPARRDRNRYHMDVREIKEMAMRTASSLERAEEKLKSELKALPQQLEVPQLLIGLIPVFWKEFSVDIQNADVVQSVRTFTPTQNNPVTSFAGLDRIVHTDGSKVQVHRNGLIVANRRLALVTVNDDPRRFFYVEAIDDILHGFVTGASHVYQAAGIGGPFLLGMILRYNAPLIGAFPEGTIPNAVIIAEPVGGVVYSFPIVQATDLTSMDRTIRPLCDQAHQMWGRDGSTRFDGNGNYIRR
jgi:hypothetical protein